MIKCNLHIAKSGGFLRHWLNRSSVLMLFITVIALMMVVVSCKNGKPHEHAQADVDSYYTCSMHPQVMQPGPGKCPICGMTLIKVEKTIAPKADEIQLSNQQIQLGNINSYNQL
jgi:membrane fusion protein, copper/silver efflux system